MSALVVQDVTVGYGIVEAVRSVSMNVPANGRVAVIGSNGAGKSSTVKAVNGLLPLRGGRVTFAGKDISTLKPHERVRAGIATVPEGRLLFPTCTVLENLAAASMFYPLVEAAAEREKVFSLFPRLRERAKQRAGTMSGGEQQMLAIGRALMTRPSLLILDEPSIGLAPRVVSEIFEVLSHLASQGLSLLMVEQNVKLSLAAVDYAYVFKEGRIVLEGKAADLAADVEVRRAYLGA